MFSVGEVGAADAVSEEGIPGESDCFGGDVVDEGVGGVTWKGEDGDLESGECDGGF